VTALRACELYRFYRAGEEETLALRGVSIAVSAGRLLTVTGPSGSGKSTLLACLAGLDEPDGGSVYVHETRISHRPEHERSALRARHIGTLFQSANLLEHLTVRRNLELVQRIAAARDRARRQGGNFVLIAPPGSPAHHILSMVQIPVASSDSENVFAED